MKGVFKCGLLGALFAVLSIGLFTGSSASASTWVDDTPLEVCTDVDYNFYEAIAYWGERMGPIWDPENIDGEIYGFITESQSYPNALSIAMTTEKMTVGTDEHGHYIEVVHPFQHPYVNAALTFQMVPKIKGSTEPPFDYNGVSMTGQGYGAPLTVKHRLSCISQVTPHGLEYDESYTGPPIPGPDGPGPVTHKPNITWSVNDKDVIVYSDDAKNTAVLEDYQIYWFISNTTFDTKQPSEPFALSGCTPPDYNNNFTVPIYFDYGVQVYYADEDCNILQVDDEGNRLSDNMEVLTIDGSTFDGSTTDHEAIIGEIEENEILKAIRKFRPNDGGLAGLIYAPIEAVATLPTIVGSCSPIKLPLLGEEVSLECIRPTIQASPMGAVYNTISVIITGIVTWWVAWKTFGTIKGIQDPQDDRVEVLKL